MSESTTCDETTSTIHFPVPFEPIFQIFFFEKMLTFFSSPVNFLTVRDPPYGEKTENILEAQIKRFGTMNATQKNRSLYIEPFLKKLRKTTKNWPFLTKNAFLTIFRQFFLFFSRTVLCRGLRFFALRSVSLNA